MDGPNVLIEHARFDPDTGLVESMTFVLNYGQNAARVHIQLSPPVNAGPSPLDAARRELERFAMAANDTIREPRRILSSKSLATQDH
jgi:hypothetical protein